MEAKLLIKEGETAMKPNPAVPIETIPRVKAVTLREGRAGGYGTQAPTAPGFQGSAMAMAYLAAHSVNCNGLEEVLDFCLLGLGDF